MSLQTRLSALITAIGADIKTLSTAVAGKAPLSHTHVATTDLTATGTKNNTTYLRGDNVWAAVTAGGTVYQQPGTPSSPPVGAIWLDTDETLTPGFVPLGTANTDVALLQTLLMETDTRDTTFGYTGSNLTTITEKDGSTTVRTTTLAYSGGNLSTITEVGGGKTVTTTLNYTGSNLTSITRSVS